MDEQSDGQSEVEMQIVGLVMDPGSNAPIIILREQNTGICLPIWIGLAEAGAIASGLRNMEFPRPMTHDLLKQSIERLGGRIQRILVSELRDSTFIALVEVLAGEVLHEIDARPSDAIAIAVRAGVPIFVSTHVLAQAQVTLVQVDQPQGFQGDDFHGQVHEGGVQVGEDVPIQVGDERDFQNIDREKWEGILAEMSPDDFKYKM
jgi:bifunctional DNase/RNase